ncbi:hypothetical protein ABPG72_006227 [Tetrahymena utriculariae]
MKKKTSAILSILISLLQLQFSNNIQCPQITTYHQMKCWSGYQIYNYLKLPNTNLLLVNSVAIQNDVIVASIIYYNDISRISDNIIGVIQPEFPIQQMEYIQQTNEIFVQNTQNVIFADPYTLKSVYTLKYANLIGMSYISGSNYAIVVEKEYRIYVIDVVKRVQNFLLNINPFISILGVVISMAKIFSLQNGNYFVYAIYQNGPTTWSLDFKTQTSTFNGFFQQDSAWRKQISLRLNKSQQKSTFSLNREKGSVYIKVLTNYLQIMGSINALDPSITSGSPVTLFTEQINASPVLGQIEPFDLETNQKQDQRQQKLDLYQLNSSNNKIQHEIICLEGNTNEAINN